MKIIWQTSWFLIFNAQLAVKVMTDGLGFQEIAFNSSVVSERMGGGGVGVLLSASSVPHCGSDRH